MIADKIFNLASFKRQFDAVLILSVSKCIPNLVWSVNKEIVCEQIDWDNILSLASCLSYSSKSEHLDAALRIAQTCLACESSELHKSAAVIILENLTNQRAIHLAVKRDLIKEDYFTDFPLPFKLQTNRIRIENSMVAGGDVLELNQFQKSVYDASLEFDSLSISAPTSAGKSFILYQLLMKELEKGISNIVYIVPTRALISQVEADLRDMLKQKQMFDINLTSVPHARLNNICSNLFIFTQERLHWFLTDYAAPRIDVLLVDEAHKIHDGNRGILLQQKIEDVVSMNPAVKLYFSSPFTANPEILFKGLQQNNHKNKEVSTEFVAVNQNLLYVSQTRGKVKLWEVNLILKEKSINLGTVTLRDRPSSPAKKVAYISAILDAGDSGTLIYVNGAADAEKQAALLYDFLPEIPLDKELTNLIELVRKAVHRDYSLAKVLRRGIAFHYGSMPLIIRDEIERLFKLNKIRYLICTSTLLEGVNLPATTVVMRNPTRGKGKPLNHNDFWNLAGRAGRWGQEFSGNIVCVDPNDWKEPPSADKKRLEIVRALDTIEAVRSENFIAYLEARSPRELAATNQDLEYAFGYYYNRYLTDQLLPTTTFRSRVLAIFEQFQDEIILPSKIILRNPGISPIAQQELFGFFGKNAERLEAMIPVVPEDNDSYAHYVELVGRIGSTIAFYPAALNASRAVLLLNWMAGKPLSYIIQKSYESYQKRDDPKSLPVIIREVMKNIEDFVRFTFAKDLSCYVDVLRFYLESIGQDELIQRIPNQLNQWLEFGVSEETHLSLLALGLSRNSVIEVSKYISRSDMSVEDSLRWLQESDLELMELSPIIIKDIRRCLPTPQ